jgi:urea transporter
MKTLFSLVNFVVGLFTLLIGAGNVLFQSNNPAGAVAGLVAMVVGATFLGLATQAMLGSAKDH